MSVTLSVAVTADGYLDDRTPARAMISTPEDWAEVLRLRARHDAILVGAETLRHDDPSLSLRDETVRRERQARGLRPDLAKVTLTRSGRLDRALRFFSTGDAERYVFAPRPLPELDGAATVIVADAPISAGRIVTELEKRGVERLFVEGGAHVLDLFLREGLADMLRIAVNPAMRFGRDLGGAHFEFRPPADATCRHERFGSMEVATWQLHPDTRSDDLHYLRMAIDESRKCTPCATSYCVGAVVVTPDGRTFRGHTHETSPTRHAEQEAVAKALAAGATLRGAAIYSSMEPCSKRASEPESCTQLILRHGFARVVFALYEPDRFVCCQGAVMLREAGIRVRFYPELSDAVRAVNAHLWR